MNENRTMPCESCGDMLGYIAPDGKIVCADCLEMKYNQPIPYDFEVLFETALHYIESKDVELSEDAIQMKYKLIKAVKSHFIIRSDDAKNWGEMSQVW